MIRIFEKPSRFCGMCEDMQEKCVCRCHKEKLFAGYHHSVIGEGMPLNTESRIKKSLKRIMGIKSATI